MSDRDLTVYMFICPRCGECTLSRYDNLKKCPQCGADLKTKEEPNRENESHG